MERKVRNPKLQDNDGDDPLSGQRKTVVINMITTEHHWSSRSGMPSLRVSYLPENYAERQVSEYLCFEHEGYAKQKAGEIWIKLGGQLPIPQSVEDAKDREIELRRPSAVKIERDGKYWRVMKRIY